MKSIRTLALGIALISVAGSAMAQGFRGGFRGGFGGGGSGLVMIPEVQKELKLDPAQIDLLKQLGEETRSKMREMFQSSQGLSEEERGRKFREFGLQQEKNVNDILDAKQKARLKQLELQQAGNRALDRKEVADALKLTPDQRSRVQSAITAEREGMRAMFEGFRSGGAQPSQEQRQESFRKMGELRTATDTTLNSVLTEPQKKQFQALQGAPFKFPERQRGPRRGNNNNT